MAESETSSDLEFPKMIASPLKLPTVWIGIFCLPASINRTSA
jgi:hypothetical protein